jgi:hypothetical protein
MRCRQFFSLTVLSLVLVSCGGGSSSPTPTNPTPSPSGVSFIVAISVGPSGTYSATLNGQTYTTQSGFQATLQPGTYEISGSYAGGNLVVGFASLVGGGVQTGSVRSTAGTVLTSTSCGLAYAAGSGAQTFRVQFTVGTNSNTSC